MRVRAGKDGALAHLAFSGRISRVGDKISSGKPARNAGVSLYADPAGLAVPTAGATASGVLRSTSSSWCLISTRSFQ